MLALSLVPFLLLWMLEIAVAEEAAVVDHGGGPSSSSSATMSLRHHQRNHRHHQHYHRRDQTAVSNVFATRSSAIQERRRRRWQERRRRRRSQTPAPVPCDPNAYVLETWYLVDAARNQRLRPVAEGDTVALSQFPDTDQFTVQAVYEAPANNNNQDTVSVEFRYPSAPSVVVDNVAPYSLDGSAVVDNYDAIPLLVGDWTIQARLYCGPDATGQASGPVTLAFTVTQSLCDTLESTFFFDVAMPSDDGSVILVDGTTAAAPRLANTASPALACDRDFTIFTHTIFFQFTGDGQSYRVATTNVSTFDTMLGLLEGGGPNNDDCGTARCVLSNDDFDGALTSRVAFRTTDGAAYWLLVGGFGGSVGNFRVTFERVPDCPEPAVFQQFYLVAASTNERLRPVDNGDIILLSNFTGTDLDLEVEYSQVPVDASVELVASVADDDDPFRVVSNEPPPYTLPLVTAGGGAAGDRVGNYNVTSTVYCDRDATGVSGVPNVVQFTIVESICPGVTTLDRLFTGLTVEGTTVGAFTLVENAPALTCFDFGPVTRTVFYQFQGDGAMYVISTVGSSFDTVLGVLEGPTCPNATCILSNDDFVDVQSQITLETTDGQPYWLAVGGFRESTGDFIVTVTETTNSPTGTPRPTPAPTAPIPADAASLVACQQAEEVPISDGLVLTGSNEEAPFASTSSPAFQCRSFAEESRTIYFEVVGGSGVYTVSTEGSSFDTVLGVLEGSSCGRAFCIASNDDFGTEETSVATFDFLPRNRYWIAVGGFDVDSVGSVVVTIVARILTNRPSGAPTPRPTPLAVPTIPLPTTPGSALANVNIEIQTDDAPEEITVSLIRNGDTTNPILEQGPFSESETGYSFPIRLPEGAYSLVFSDLGLDGLCCGKGLGFFRLFFGEQAVFSIGKFGGTFEIEFDVSAQGEPTLVTQPATVEGLQPSCNEDVEDEFNICLYISSSTEINPSWIQDLGDAIQQWQEIITSDDIDAFPPGGFSGDGSRPDLVDDLYISATAEPIDGSGRVLGFAGPERTRGIEKNGVSYVRAILGSMVFDTADVEDELEEDTFLSTAAHEIAHVLGIGTLWETNGIYSQTTDVYSGEFANREYRSYGFTDPPDLPIESGGGSATAGGHWDEDCLADELMTGFGSAGVNPLSRVTIGGLQDLGYDVDYSRAEDYTSKCRCGNTSPVCANNDNGLVDRRRLGQDSSELPSSSSRRQSHSLEPDLLEHAQAIADKVLAERERNYKREQRLHPDRSMVFSDSLEMWLRDESGKIFDITVTRSAKAEQL